MSLGATHQPRRSRWSCKTVEFDLGDYGKQKESEQPFVGRGAGKSKIDSNLYKIKDELGVSIYNLTWPFAGVWLDFYS